MKPPYLSIFLFPILLASPLSAQQPAPEKALKYHEALLKRPQNSTLLDRFFGAWIDEQPIETLDAFLKDRAEKNGGQDLAILAQHQLRRGLEDDALQTLAKAITALPDEVYLPMERAKIQLRRLDFEAARKDLEKVTQGKDTALTLEATKLIGKSWLREGNSKNAIETWDKLLAANPTDEDLLEDLIESAAAEGEIDQALTYAQKLIAASTDPYKKTLRQLRQGDLLAQAGRNDDAVKNYSDTLAQVGEGSWLEREILAQIDKAFRKQDRLNDLKNTFVELAEANPRRLLIHRQLAKLEADQGDVESAVGRFREVLKRTPGNNELREEFIRLLTDTEKYADASEEINKLITQAPDNTSLLLQLADIQQRQKNKEACAATLEKALKLYGPDENSGIRIASLMFQYGNEARGEEILKNLSAAQNATIAPAESLASQYARANRKPEAIAIFKKIGEDKNLDVILRAAGSISALGENNTAFELLAQKIEAHNQDSHFLAAIAQAALASGKHDEAIKHAIRLVRISKQTNEIAQSIELTMRAITAGNQGAQWQDTFEKQAAKTPAEICLYAALAESSGDFDKVEKLMAENSDPVVIRFHCIILERRNEWDKAITVLTRLADTDEGRKASYFKDLSELQRNAGQTKEALATIERWKQSAPTDKTAWIVGSSILRDNAQTDEAVKMVRQAVSRFKDDMDLAANLAQLHEEAGQLQEAQSIYWELYDNSEKPADQARWATNLSKIATQTGRTQELEEQLIERSRNNRRSIGPLLAQAELARLTQNEDKRRDLLLEAVRLQPNNVDLRLQISNLEEQSGNPDRVIAILEEAVATDTTGRIRNSLAQAYLRQGQVLKGMRELQKIAGTQAPDPRVIEANAASLASSGLYDEAIRYMREALPDGGDWRSKYLLAIMLEQDGRESEAIPLFQSLLLASEEIPSFVQMKKLSQNADEQDYWKDYPQSMKDIMQLMSVGQAAYMHRNTDRNQYSNYYSSNNGLNQIGIFILPDATEFVRSLTKIHLAKIDPKSIENAAFINDLIGSKNEYQPDFTALLKKYPNYPGIFELSLAYTSWNDETKIDKELLRSQLANNKSLNNSTRLQIYTHLIQDAEPNDTAWQDLVSVSEEISKSSKPGEVMQLGYMIMQILTLKREDDLKIPDSTRKSLSKILIDAASKDLTDQDPMGNFKLVAINAAGTQEQWIQAVNDSVKSFRTEKKPQAASTSLSMRNYAYAYGYYNPNTSVFVLPQINTLTLRSIPGEVMQMIQPLRPEGNNYGYDMPDPKKLITQIDKFESPTLRAWIAIQAEDQVTIDKILTTTPPENEATDFKTLQAFQSIVKKDYPTAYKLFSELRPAYSSDRNLINWLNKSLVAIANEMKPEDRTALNEELRALLIQSRANLGLQGAPAIAAQAEKFGMTDLAKRFIPQNTTGIKSALAGLGPANFGANPQPSSSNSSNASIEKMEKFATDGKLEAAALEALNLIRKANKSSYNRSHEIAEIKESLTPEVLKELLKISDPGDSNSLTKLIEYADICSDFGKRDIALKVLTKLNKERPDDLIVTGKLAFLLPADQRDLAIKLISMSASKEEFLSIAISTAEYLSESKDTTAYFNYISTITAWLQSADPKDLSETNLSWISFIAINLFQGYFNDELPSLIEDKTEDHKDSKLYTEYVNTAKNLATAILRHPSIAEEGFRLIGSSHAWKVDPNQRDEQARQVFLTTKIKPKNDNNEDINPFSIRIPGNYSNSGEQLEKQASVKWISDRVIAAKSPDDVLSPAYLKQLSEQNPEVGELITSLTNLTNIKQLETSWKSDLLKKSYDPFIIMYRSTLVSRARLIPESSSFFIDRINELTPKSIEESRHNTNNSTLSLFSAALISASMQKDPAYLTKTCTVISQKIFGDKIDYKSDKDTMKIYNAINMMDSIFDNSDIEPENSIRIFNTFYKLGIPVGQREYQLTQAFDDIEIKDVNQAVKIFTSFGWLNDIDTWEPFSAIFIESNHNGQSVTFTRKEMFVMPQAISNIDKLISSNQIISHLEGLKPQTFGNLITAACLANGNQRTTLTEKAFNLVNTKLAGISAERAKTFTPLLPWLPESAINKLPDSFKESLGNAKTEKLAKLNHTADEFLKSPTNPQNYGSPFNHIQDLVTELMPLDRNKAVAVFLEADKRFTESLGRGGRISSYTSNDIQITERDEALERMMRDNENKDPARHLAFYQAIASSPEASRYSFAASEKYTPILYRIGQDIHSINQANTESATSWLTALKNVEALPANVKNDAYFALGIFSIENEPRRLNVQLPNHRNELEKAKDLNELARNIRILTIGVSKWNSDSPEGHLATRNAVTYLANFPDVATTTRFQLLFVSCYMAPFMLSDAIIAETFTKSFEEYAAGDRSVINSIGLYTENIISMAPAKDETRPFLTRINQAFWKNANSIKSGGHPNIPKTFAPNLLMCTAAARDDANTIKLLNLSKPEIAGNAHAIYALIYHGYFDLAKQIICPINKFHPIPNSLPSYNSLFEKNYIEFKKSAGINPLSILRLDALFLDICPVQTDESKASESYTDREKRIIATYLANPPKELMLRTEIVSRIIRDSHTAAISLHDEVISISKQLNLQKSLTDWGKGTGDPSDLIPRYIISPAECAIFRQAAFLQLLDGDASALNTLVDTILSQPGDIDRERYGNYNYIGEYIARINSSIPVWIMQAIHLDKTSGFKNAYNPLAKIAIYTDNSRKFGNVEVQRAVTIIEFLAFWNGEPNAFAETRKQIKNYANYFKYLDQRKGLIHFFTFAKENKAWMRPTFTEARHSALIKIFSKPEMGDYLGQTQDIISATIKTSGLKEDIMKIAKTPPDTLTPKATVHILFFFAEEEFAANRFESGVTNATKAIELCPIDGAWKDVHFRLCFYLMDRLIKANQMDQAKNIHAMVKVEALNEGQKKRYDEYALKFAPPTN